MWHIIVWKDPNEKGDSYKRAFEVPGTQLFVSMGECSKARKDLVTGRAIPAAGSNPISHGL